MNAAAATCSPHSTHSLHSTRACRLRLRRPRLTEGRGRDGGKLRLQRGSLRRRWHWVVALAVGSAAPARGQEEMESAWRPVAGTGKSGFGGSTGGALLHGFGIETRLNSPWGLALDTTLERLYIADTLNNVVRSLDLETGLMDTIAGTGRAGFSGDGGPAQLARLRAPTGLALDATAQQLYVADTNNHRVRVISLRPGRVYQAEVDASATDTTALQGAEVRHSCPEPNPTNFTPLLAGSRFCDGATGKGYVIFQHATGDHVEFRFDASEGAGQYHLRFRYADRFAGSHAGGDRQMRLYVNGVVETHGLLFRPTGATPVGSRKHYGWTSIAVTLQTGSNVVRLEVVGHGGPLVDHLYVAPAEAHIHTVAGTGSPGDANDAASPQPAGTSPLRSPTGLVVHPASSKLYIADAGNGRVRRLDLSAQTIDTVAGSRTTDNTRDGLSALNGKLFRPSGLALDSSGQYLYISDEVDHRVRRVDLSEDKVSTICGFGKQKAPMHLLLRAPQGLALDDAAGLLYVADRDNAQIRSAGLTLGQCPSLEASRLECATRSTSAADCEALGCCYDAAHPHCANPFAPDGRMEVPVGTILTKLQQREQEPPVTFVQASEQRCCYPKLVSMSTLDVLDDPAGIALDAREGGVLYVAQPRRNRVVRLLIEEGRCAANAAQC